MDREKYTSLLKKIKEWHEKASAEDDPFNQFISLWIAYNIFYNLIKKLKEPSADCSQGDKRRAVSTIDRIDTEELFRLMRKDLEEYSELIPIDDEEYWPKNTAKNKIAISVAFEEALANEESYEAIDLLLKWLYKVRCNVIHGDKGLLNDKHRELLAKSSILLNKILCHLLEGF